MKVTNIRITILTGLPSAGMGALIFLWICGFDLDVIGIVLLIGIFKKMPS